MFPAPASQCQRRTHGSGSAGVAPGSRPAIAFTVDTEDWAQATLDQRMPISDYCADNALRMLDLLAEQPGARGTFFVLGLFAEKHARVVRRIAADGHEVASHGYSHRPLHALTRGAFHDDLRRSLALLSDITGRAIHGFRAPVFSVLPGTLWALEILAEHGVSYDSSVFPFRGRRYGIADWPAEPARVRLPNGGTLAEVPLATHRLAGRRWPIAGGGYARLLPRRLLIHLLRREATRGTHWPVFYCHPNEIDAGEFRRPNPPWGDQRLPRRIRLHQGVGRAGFEAKLRDLLTVFDCRTVADALRTHPPTMGVSATDVAAVDDVPGPRRSFWRPPVRSTPPPSR